MKKVFAVYIMTNFHNTVLYTGITNNIYRRVWEHQQKQKTKNFTAKYNIKKLVYYETYEDIEAALNREKQIKAGSRQKKINLIDSINPDWKDLYNDLF